MSRGCVAARTFVKAMELTNQQPDFRNRGVSFELIQGEIAALLQ